MQENTNKAIVINSVILYIKMIVMVLSSVFTTRFALQALGVVDFGLYSLLGGIISLIAIFNTIMISTSHRFISVSIGRGNALETNKQFNVNLLVHIGIAIGTLLFAFPIGEWYITSYINYEGDISKALLVFNISMTASIVSFVGVPYNALLMAKEKFVVFTGAEIGCQLSKLAISYLLIYFFKDKLLVYSLALGILTVIPVFIYVKYCYTNYYDIVQLKLIKDRKKYKEVLDFSLWVSIGAVAMVGKNQGAALLVNLFFNTIMNTALGVAHSLVAFFKMFSQNIIQPMAPQITKSYAAGDNKRTDELLMMSTKYAFLFMLLASSPFLIAPEWLLQLWLGKVPPYSVPFLFLMVIENLIYSFNAGISNLIFASGKIKYYQIITSSLNILSVMVGYIVLKYSNEVLTLFYIYIFFSILNVLAVQWILYKTINYNNKRLLLHSYLPSITIIILFIPSIAIKFDIYPLIRILLSFIYLCCLILIIGLRNNEKKLLYKNVNIFISKIFKRNK